VACYNHNPQAFCDLWLSLAAEHGVKNADSEMGFWVGEFGSGDMPPLAVEAATIRDLRGRAGIRTKRNWSKNQ